MPDRLALSVCCALVFACLPAAQDVKLLANINRGQAFGVPSSSPSEFQLMGSRTFFAASTWQHGRELWVFDGAAGTARLLHDIHASGASAPASLTVIGPRLWFVAEDETHGREVWVSDGTAAGTQRVADIAPGASSCLPLQFATANFTPLGSRVLFFVNDVFHGVEPWISDGTTAGTRLVRDINPAQGSFAGGATALSGLVYFSAHDGRNGTELWRTDGTAAGTSLVVDLHPSDSAYPMLLCADAAAGVLYFVATTPSTGRELWCTDGTAAGTRLVIDLSPGAADTTFDDLRCAGGRVFFAARRQGPQPLATLWVSDGTSSGTTIVRAPAAGGPSEVRALTAVGGRVFFFATDAAGSEPWVSDGSAAGTLRLADTVAGPDSAIVQGVLVQGARVFFATSAPELWASDLTPASTIRCGQVAVSALGARAGGVLFAGGSPHGNELWTSDGTPAGTRLAADLWPRSQDAGSRPEGLVSLGPFALFTATDAAHGAELWRTDGSAAGTRMVKDIVPGPASSRPAIAGAQGAQGGRAYFTVLDGSLWVTDGTQAGTVRLVGSGVSAGRVFVLAHDRVVFQRTNSQSDGELWVSDGTPAGTRFVRLFTAPTAPSEIEGAVAVDAQSFAVVTNTVGSLGQPKRLWWSDGTASGTRLVSELATSGPTTLLAVAGRVFVHHTSNGSLFVSDGTPAGSFVLAPFAFSVLTQQGTSWFVDLSGLLWRSDGTRAGTLPAVLLPSGSMQLVTSWRGRLLLREARVDPLAPSATVLWSTDGTAVGTAHFATVPGRASVLGTLGSERLLLWSAAQTSPETAESLWSVDAGGVLQRVLVRPHAEGQPNAALPAIAGGKVVFAYDDGTIGSEPYVWDPGATATPLTTGCVGAGRRADLTCSDPRLGATMIIAGAGAPNAVVSLWLGMPVFPMLRTSGCVLPALPEVLLAAFVPPAPKWVRMVPIPRAAHLLGSRSVVQAVWGPLAGGVDVSPGVLLHIGR
jgi:ELWxxDGT repeat protein